MWFFFFFFQAEDGIRDFCLSRGLGDVYKRQVLDGQQRITSIGRFITGKFAIKNEADNVQYFSGLPEEQQQKIMQSSLLVYECEGEEKEIKEWFKTINIVGIPLKEQELLNAIYSGEFVNAAKRVFSNSQNAEIQKWNHYIKGDVKRQDYLAEALRWICDSKGMSIDAYMSIHRHEPSTGELEGYFRSVIDWVSTTFTMVERDMCGLEWGRLYETYHTTPYSTVHVTERVKALQADESLSLIHISEPTRQAEISYAVFCLKKKKKKNDTNKKKTIKKK